MNIKILIVFLSILHFVSGIFAVDEPKFDFPQNRSSIRVPVMTAHNLVILPLRINDGPPLNFILDTGVNNTILSEPLVARALGLEGDKMVYVLGLGSQGIVEALKITGITMNIEGIMGKNLNLLVIPEDVLELSEMFGFPIHGIIGHDLLNEFPVSINYSNNYVVFHRDSDYRIRRRSNTIPLELRNNKPYIDATISGINDTTVTIPLLLDLGASHSLFLSNRYDFLTKDSTTRSYLGRGISGDLMGEEGRLSKVQLSGDMVIENTIVAYPDPMEMWIEKFDIQWDGLIGGGILSRFHLIIDYPSGQLVLRKNEKFGKPFYGNLSGLDLIAKGINYDEIVVSYVRSSSPSYEAGLKEGDKIIRVNNKRAPNISLQDAINALNEPPGTRINLVVSREITVKDDEGIKESKTRNLSYSFNLKDDI